MKKLLITGGNAFLAHHFINKYKRKYKIICLYRKLPIKKNVNIISYHLKNTTLEKVFLKENKIDYVIHNAALHSGIDKNYGDYFKSNVILTKKIFFLAKKYNVKVFLYVSSARTIGQINKVSKFNTKYNLHKIDNFYGYTKYLGEKFLYHQNTKMNIKFINPSMIVGTHDFKPSPCGELFQKVIKGRIIPVIDTTVNIVDVDDVCFFLDKILNRGKNKKRYIVCAETITLKQFFNLISSNKKKIYLHIPYILIFSIYQLFSRFFGKQRYNINSFLLAKKKFIYDGKDILREFNYKYKNIKKTIDATRSWHNKVLSTKH
jgi:nucleoside-diphosphate-sugar epimerase